MHTACLSPDYRNRYTSFFNQCVVVLLLLKKRNDNLLLLHAKCMQMLIISNIFWKKFLGTWMNMVWISVKICFPSQIRCQWNAESNVNDMPLFGAVAYVGVPTMEPFTALSLSPFCDSNCSKRDLS